MTTGTKISQSSRKRLRGKLLRYHVLPNGSWRCCWCQQVLWTPEEVTMDHIVPLARGGAHTLENVRPACKPCNYGRGDGTTHWGQTKHGDTAT